MVYQFGEFPRLDLVDGDGVVEVEISALDSAQFEHVCATAEPAAEIRTDGANVCSFGAMNSEIHIRQFDASDIKGMDGDFAGLPFDGLSFARQFVQWLAVEFNGGDHGGRLQLRAYESGGGFTYLRFRDGGKIRRCSYLACAVFRIRFEAETHGGGIDFILPHQLILQLGGLAEQNHKKARGDWIKRPAMADFFNIETAFDAIDDIVASPIHGLVHDENAIVFILLQICC